MKIQQKTQNFKCLRFSNCHRIIFGIQIYFESIQDFHHQCYKNNSNINIIIINNLENLDKITKKVT